MVDRSKVEASTQSIKVEVHLVKGFSWRSIEPVLNFEKKRQDQQLYESHGRKWEEFKQTKKEDDCLALILKDYEFLRNSCDLSGFIDCHDIDPADIAQNKGNIMHEEGGLKE